MSELMNLSTIEQEIYNLLSPSALAMGYEIVRLKFSGSTRKVLEVSIDKLDLSGVTIKDCRDATTQFSALLDVEDIIKDKYFLEISSAGLERPLNNLNDFQRFIGQKAQVKLNHAHEGSRNFQIEILEVLDNKILVRLTNNKELTLEFSEIKSAKLIFTEEMFRESLAKSNLKNIQQEEKDNELSENNTESN
ncbi:MAG: ribosome maturation factor RimP [Rickettsiaceae bacterium]|nr:ribosome maturation factor RimP [Rickettsiaceae bacterium]